MPTYVYHISGRDANKIEKLIDKSNLDIDYEFMHEISDDDDDDDVDDDVDDDL